MNTLIFGVASQGGSGPPATSFDVQDTFTDTNGTLLTAHTPDTDTVGTGWAGSGDFEIQSNVAEFVGAGSDAFIGIDAGVTTGTYEVTITRTSGNWHGLWFCGNSTSGTIPSNVWFVEADINGTYELFERVSGTRTSRGTGGTPSSSAEAWRVVVTSTSIAFYVDDVLTISYSPGGSLTFADSYCGIKTGSVGTVTWDDLEVTGA